MIFPALTSTVTFFLPALDIREKILISLSASVIYFMGSSLYLNHKLKKDKSEITDLKEKVDIYITLSNQRELFVKHDLKKLRELIIEFRGYVVDTYRGRKFERFRSETKLFKDKTVEIIDKEMRDYDEQLQRIQSDKDN